MKPTKHSVALVLTDAAGRTLVVERPDEPGEELPGIWGLPAGTALPGEGLEACARRVAAAKLGIALEAPTRLATGRVERPGYHLELTLMAARLAPGSRVRLAPAPAGATTTYHPAAEWLADAQARLGPGAARGSLCCQLFIELGR